MKRIASVVLTAALVLGMATPAWAATPSKTVLDEVKPTITTTVTGEGTVTVAAAETAEEVAQTQTVLSTVSSTVDLKAEVGAAADENVEVTAATTFTVSNNTLASGSSVQVTIDSALTSTYADGETVTVLAAVPVLDANGNPVLDANGNPVMQYVKLTAVAKDGKVQLTLSAAQLQQLGNKFTLLALKKTAAQ